MPLPIVLLFQFTPLREGRRGAAAAHHRQRNFNSRPSARGDGSTARRRLSPAYFNSRPSARGDSDSAHSEFIGCYFNSRPSARGDGIMRLAKQGKNVISIHAPPRGATQKSQKNVICRLFQFTPLREGRPRRSGGNRDGVHFNSRPSARGDNRRRRKRDVHGISIHAPPRGATAFLDAKEVYV